MKKIACVKCGVKILLHTANKFDGICATCFKHKEKEDIHEKFMNTPGCPSCDGSKYLSFSWKGKYHFSKYRKYIKFIKKLKYGALYECICCHAFWWLGGKHRMMNLIQPERLALFQRWSQSVSKLPLTLLIKSLSIEITPPDIYGNGSEYITIPCQIETTEGVIYKKALIKITKKPPLLDPIGNVLLANDIINIEPTPYALPPEVREAASKAREIRMCFSPTLVQTYTNEVYILNGVCNFFDRCGFKGNDIRLAEKNINFREADVKPLQYYNDNNNDIYFIYVDPSFIHRNTLFGRNFSLTLLRLFQDMSKFLRY